MVSLCFRHRRRGSPICVCGHSDKGASARGKPNTDVGFDVRYDSGPQADFVSRSIYLLIVGEQSEMTLDLLHEFEYRSLNARSVDLGPRVIAITVKGPTDSDWQVIALDVHSRTQLLFPSHTGAACRPIEVSILVHALHSSPSLTFTLDARPQRMCKILGVNTPRPI